MEGSAIKSVIEEHSSCHLSCHLGFDLVSYLQPCSRPQTIANPRATTQEQFALMAGRDPLLASLIHTLSVMRLVTVSFLPVLRFADLITVVPVEF